MPHAIFTRSDSISDLASLEFLSELFGRAVRDAEVQPLKTSGFSGSAHEKVVVKFEKGESTTLILKTIYPAQDMTIWRSGNIGDREARILDDKEMAGVWDIFQSPSIAYAIEDSNTALLMRDISANLFPDLREPILAEQEDLILQKLAQLHARYWQHSALSKKWLARQEIFFGFLGPYAVKEERGAGRNHPIFDHVRNGWDLALQWLPAELREFVLHPPIQKMTEGLAKTLIHGDSKLANFAIMPDKKVCAFDWTLSAGASPAIEIGWFIAVNASRLARSKEQVMNRYRQLLETASGFSIEGRIWNQMVHVAILTGVETLLWNKALNVQKGLPGAKEEWNWWKDSIGTVYLENKSP